jgi:hypothetical protein
MTDIRDDDRTYSSDGLALEVANRAIARGGDRRIAADLREFLYLPLMHSKHLADQQRQCRQPQICRGSCQYCPPVRAFSPPQRRSGTHDNAGRTGLSRRRRIFRLTER